MIFGIGVDLVAIARLEQGLARFGEHYADRILSVHEHSEFFASAAPARFLAKRFAAKEALAKAVGTGLRHPLALRHIAVQHDSLGRPHFRFDDAVAAWLKARGVGAHHLSLTDEREQVVAFVVLENA